jgi:hypothetical protein
MSAPGKAGQIFGRTQSVVISCFREDIYSNKTIRFPGIARAGLHVGDGWTESAFCACPDKLSHRLQHCRTGPVNTRLPIVACWTTYWASKGVSRHQRCQIVRSRAGLTSLSPPRSAASRLPPSRTSTGSAGAFMPAAASPRTGGTACIRSKIRACRQLEPAG